MPGYTNPRGRQVGRRQLLGMGLGVAGAAVLGACSNGTGGPAAKQKPLRIPNYTPPRTLPGVTVSKVPGVGPAFDAYPSTPFKSVTKTPITSGKPVTTFQILFPAPPPPLAKNQWWQELNQRLGAEFKPTLAPYLSYGEKLQTVIASGNIPDITFIEPGQRAGGVVRTLKEGAFTDLTDILAGDGVKAYPNLAQFPTYAWQNCGIEGSIYGVPRPISLLTSEAASVYRKDWATKLGFPNPPTNTDELAALMTAFAKGPTWAHGALYPRTYHMMFRVPNFWRLDPGGKLTYWIESEELEQSLTYQNKLWKAGAFHPDAPTNVWTPKAEDLFVGDKVGMFSGGVSSTFGSTGNLSGKFVASHPDAGLVHWLPVGVGSAKPMIWQQSGYFGILAIPATVGKDTNRVAELLRVLDYFGAPFGSEEYLFLNFGDQGRHFTFDSSGNPKTKTGAVSNEYSLNYMDQPDESVNFWPGIPGDSLAGQKYLEQAAQTWVPNPVQGLVSDTDIRKSEEIRQIEDDYQLGIITGRRPFSDLTKWRNEWKKAGGEQIRSEYQESLQRAKK
jgi:putative aldouronate transport system substrate-binding protein